MLLSTFCSRVHPFEALNPTFVLRSFPLFDLPPLHPNAPPRKSRRKQATQESPAKLHHPLQSPANPRQSGPVSPRNQRTCQAVSRVNFLPRTPVRPATPAQVLPLLTRLLLPPQQPVPRIQHHVLRNPSLVLRNRLSPRRARVRSRSLNHGASLARVRSRSLNHGASLARGRSRSLNHGASLASGRSPR